MEIFNMFCDESCHLNYVNESYMGFSTVVCKKDKIKEINQNIFDIKIKNNIPVHQELKWSKVSKSNVEFYKQIIDYFFIDDDLSFRAFLVKNKQKLKFTEKNTKSEFYYKMMYFMILKFIDPNYKYNIYLDIKDTCSSERINNLQKYLNKTKLDYSFSNTILKIQAIRSYESNILQLADVILGAIMYCNKYPIKTGSPKHEIVEYIKKKSNRKLTKSTLQKESKFNIFIADAKRMRLRGENEL